MKRPSIFALLAVLILAVAGGALWYVSRSPHAPSSTNSGTGGIFPGNTSSVSGGETRPSNDADKSAVAATYSQALIKDGNYDHARLGTTAVVGTYALQAWKGDSTAGEALLKRSAGGWNILDSGGGEWSVAELMKFGMDKKTALTLLSEVRVGQ